MTRRPGRRPPLLRHLRGWVDPFVLAILAALLVGVAVPVPDTVHAVLDSTSAVAVSLLFLLYGARLPTREIGRSLRDWRLQGGLLVATFVLYPVAGVAVAFVATPFVGTGVATGLLCVSLLPSTVSSAIAFTSVARGDVAGAICGATVSNVAGLLLTPLLVLVLVSPSAPLGAGLDGADAGGLQTVLVQLLLPFAVGQVLQPWVGERLRRAPWLTRLVDRGTILLIVLTAVSGATAQGVWSGLTAGAVVALVAASAVLLVTMLAATWWGGRAAGLDDERRTTLMLCGSMKSLATGLPIVAALLPAATVGLVAVPIVVFHQLQLVVCSVLARRAAVRQG
ncbi:bile acid:sodium symporter [Isoptericola sp. S6320L]|uniref:bile acid:sodium symporter family protein n=1 Tax=Isoptericola sp. S6320L TaxID=2926411 RepID=UPI001FF5FC91|nr:bile acid:sodium symporter family protein [Isoptericola sp. S6320L]MCK0115968.1 bile acid:sodium symporter [Isoptericola sp. S6320L]